MLRRASVVTLLAEAGVFRCATVVVVGGGWFFCVPSSSEVDGVALGESRSFCCRGGGGWRSVLMITLFAGWWWWWGEGVSMITVLRERWVGGGIVD